MAALSPLENEQIINIVAGFFWVFIRFLYEMYIKARNINYAKILIIRMQQTSKPLNLVIYLEKGVIQ